MFDFFRMGCHEHGHGNEKWFWIIILILILLCCGKGFHHGFGNIFASAKPIEWVTFILVALIYCRR